MFYFLINFRTVNASWFFDSPRSQIHFANFESLIGRASHDWINELCHNISVESANLDEKVTKFNKTAYNLNFETTIPFIR